jgi:hypothetical protein
MGKNAEVGTPMKLSSGRTLNKTSVRGIREIFAFFCMAVSFSTPLVVSE